MFFAVDYFVILDFSIPSILFSDVVSRLIFIFYFLNGSDFVFAGGRDDYT